jgi:hypothetical protein
VRDCEKDSDVIDNIKNVDNGDTIRLPIKIIETQAVGTKGIFLSLLAGLLKRKEITSAIISTLNNNFFNKHNPNNDPNFNLNQLFAFLQSANVTNIMFRVGPGLTEANMRRLNRVAEHYRQVCHMNVVVSSLPRTKSYSSFFDASVATVASPVATPTSRSPVLGFEWAEITSKQSSLEERIEIPDRSQTSSPGLSSSLNFKAVTLGFIQKPEDIKRNNSTLQPPALTRPFQP